MTKKMITKKKKNLLLQIVENIPIGYATCYYCLLLDGDEGDGSCYMCDYGQSHGICGQPNSSYSQIISIKRKLKTVIAEKY